MEELEHIISLKDDCITLVILSILLKLFQIKWFDDRLKIPSKALIHSIVQISLTLVGHPVYQYILAHLVKPPHVLSRSNKGHTDEAVHIQDQVGFLIPQSRQKSIR